MSLSRDHDSITQANQQTLWPVSCKKNVFLPNDQPTKVSLCERRTNELTGVLLNWAVMLA